jgi:hypothetical protein
MQRIPCRTAGKGAAPVDSPLSTGAAEAVLTNWIVNLRKFENMKSTRVIIFLMSFRAFGGNQLLLPTHHPVGSAKPTAQGEMPTPQAQEELPKIILLDQSAVQIASKKNHERYREHQAKLIDLMNKGVTVLVCPECMKQYGVRAVDLIDGVQIGKPGQAHES